MPGTPQRSDTPFQRLWHGFLSARALVALALLLLQGAGLALHQNPEPELLALCALYLVVTVLTRLLAAPLPPDPQPGPSWLPLLGVDLLMVGLLQWLQSGSMNYTPLFGIPILMASVLGSLTLALGTTATATLLLLGSAWWRSLDPSAGDAAPHYLQAALTGTGYFMVAYLAYQLAQRLLSEQQMAQQSQQRAREQSQVNALVIENLSDGVLVLSQDCSVRAANPAARQLLGGQAEGMKPPFLLGAEPAWEPLWRMAHTTFASGQPQRADVGLLHPGQSPTGLRVRTWLTAAQQGTRETRTEPQCVMFLHDLRELEARLRTEKLAAMGRMSAAVAHEIRNPLAAIVQANALLGEDLSDPAQQRLCHMVQQNAERLARIAEEVLDIARVQNQIRHAPAASLALDETVTQVWNEWRATEPVRRQAMVALQAPGVQVEFDTEHLRRVLINLLDNALRFMGSQPDSLQLHTHAADTGLVSLQVWSDGAPLDPSVERHLFEPFFSSHSRSSGLGLYICRELCQRHGASLTYQRLSRATALGPTGGNAFTVTFRKTTRPAEPAGLFDTLLV